MIDRHVALDDLEREQRVAALIADREQVGKPVGDDQAGRRRLALEQRVGRNGRADADRVDRRIARIVLGQQFRDAGGGRVVVGVRLLGQQLRRDQRAVGPPRDDVGKRAAAIDPELPAGALIAGARHHRLP